jgi:hypothetical protein
MMVRLLCEVNASYTKQNVNVKVEKGKEEIRTTQANAIANLK